MSYEFFEHTADVKFKSRGKTIEEAFINSASALFETIRGEIKILESIEKTIEVEGTDIANLLHNFLEEFLFLLDSQDFLASRIVELKLDKENLKLSARVVGDEAKKYTFTNDVKAVTYNEMSVLEEDGQFVCTVVLDV